MKAEHISIASKLEDIPNVGKVCAGLLRVCGIEKPDQLKDADPLFLYDKICQLTRKTHPVRLLDVLISAVSFANGRAPQHWSEFSHQRDTLMNRGIRQPDRAQSRQKPHQQYRQVKD